VVGPGARGGGGAPGGQLVEDLLVLHRAGLRPPAGGSLSIGSLKKT